MVVAQAVSLLLWDVLLLGASFAASLLPASAACAEAGPAPCARGAVLASRSHASLFVELLVFAALLVGVLCAPLLRALFEGARAGDPPQKRAGKKQGPRGRHGLDLRVVGLLAVIVGCAAAAAAFPAAWALGFAMGTWRRAALLGYWVGLLAAALPAMDWVSRRRRVPTIIVRKACAPLLASYPASQWETLAIMPMNKICTSCGGTQNSVFLYYLCLLFVISCTCRLHILHVKLQ